MPEEPKNQGSTLSSRLLIKAGSAIPSHPLKPVRAREDCSENMTPLPNNGSGPDGQRIREKTLACFRGGVGTDP